MKIGTKKQNIKEEAKKVEVTPKKKIEWIDILIFFTIFIIFGFALLCCFPGLLTSDCIDQIGQAKNNSYYDAHPIFHSFIIGNLTKLGGIWVPALFQILVFAITWTYGCKLIRKYNNTKKNRIFQVIFTFIMCIIPLNFLYSITLWKDILYSYSILAVLIFVYVGVKEKYKYTLPQMILIGVSTVAIMKLRHNGVPIGFLMFAILFILNLINNKKLKDSLILIAAFVISFVVMSLPQWIWRVEDEANGSSVSGVLDSTKVYCMGALLNTDITLEDEEIEFLNTIMDVDMWRDNYNLYSGSGILFNSEYHSSVLKTEEGNSRFNEIFTKYAKQKPTTIIKHFIEVNSIWWSIPERGGMHSVVTNNDYLSEGTNGEYDNHSLISGGREFIESYVIGSMETSFKYELFYRPAVAILISFIAIIAVCIKERKSGYLLILFPMILNIGTYVFLISSQDHRYFYPCYMTAYISILIFAASFLKNKTKKELDKSKKLEKAKTLVIIPAYNESEAIEKVVNSVYEQKIENLDVIVINDGSKDNTYEEAKKTKAIVIDSPNNLGIGGAVQTGYLYAQENDYDIAIQLDGDGQHDPKYLRNLIEEVANGNDLVIGSRFIEKTSYDQTFLRMLGINVISFTIKLMTGRKIYDTTSGFRASSRNAIDEFVKSYPYDYPEPCTNMRMIKKGYKVKEVPVEMRQRETGVSSISPVKAVAYMFKVTLSILLMGLKD